MKLSRIGIFALIAILLLSLVGCRHSAPIFIDGYEWAINTVQAGEDGSVIACSAEQKIIYENAVEIAINCTAKNGVFTLTDMTGKNTYAGTYRQIRTDRETTIYEITVGEKRGSAVSSMTYYQDQSHMPTLIISTADYVLHFFPNRK